MNIANLATQSFLTRFNMQLSLPKGVESFEIVRNMLLLSLPNSVTIQGDHSGSSQPPIDMKIKSYVLV